MINNACAQCHNWKSIAWQIWVNCVVSVEAIKWVTIVIPGMYINNHVGSWDIHVHANQYMCGVFVCLCNLIVMLAQTFLYVWYFRYFLLRVLCRTVVQISTRKIVNFVSLFSFIWSTAHFESGKHCKCRRSKRTRFQVFAELNANGTVHFQLPWKCIHVHENVYDN